MSGIKTDLSKEMEVARRDEISLGEASIYCNLDIVNNKSSNAKAEELSARTAKEYKIEIERIFINNDTDNKSMLIKVKDEEKVEEEKVEEKNMWQLFTDLFKKGK